ncbi:MAG TPA: AbrB/MazE/SpoVT family DNA-binding domain-containing protein [Phycisphaerae bacterium]|nr:AbrB/MazE/SpoVT family DNA-binding domain-containing protein [Phycisphaerae bacterium]
MMAIHAKVQMWGNTRAVRIPKALAQEIGLESGTEVALSKSRDGLLLKPVRSRKYYRLADLLSRCKTKNPHREAITGRAGKEIF